MVPPIAPSRARRIVAWLVRKAAITVPAVLLSKLTATVETLLDARTPAWKRAVAAAVLLELAELAPTAIPASIALRYVILRTIFEAGARPALVPVDAGR